MSEIPDARAVDAMLRDMDELKLRPTEVARHSRRIGDYISDLQRRLAQQTILLVHAAGDRVAVEDKHLRALPDLRVEKRQDPSTGAIIYTTKRGRR